MNDLEHFGIFTLKLPIANKKTVVFAHLTYLSDNIINGQFPPENLLRLISWTSHKYVYIYQYIEFHFHSTHTYVHISIQHRATYVKNYKHASTIISTRGSHKIFINKYTAFFITYHIHICVCAPRILIYLFGDKNAHAVNIRLCGALYKKNQ